MGSVPAWEWGSTVAPSDMTITAETVVSMWLAPPGGAGAMRGLTVTLGLGKGAPASGTGAIAKNWNPTAAAPTKYVLSFATRGMEIKAGDKISLQIAAWTTSDAAEVRAYYGSIGKPAGLMIPILGGASSGGDVELNLTAPSTELTGPAGGKASGTLNLTNPGATDANVTLNVSGDASVTFPIEGPYLVTGGNSSEVAFDVDLSDAAAGDNRTITVAALVDGVEVGNITYTVTATAPEPDTVQTANATTSTTAGTNGTAGAKSAEGGGGIPSVGPLAGLVALVAVALVARRRRD
jgi:hypothetical protein